MGFRLILTSLPLNDLKRVIDLILRFFTEFDTFASQLFHSG